MKTFESAFAERIQSYIKLKRALGYKFKDQEDILRIFDRYLCQQGYAGPLTQRLALEAATVDSRLSRSRHARYYQVVRRFSDYLAIFEPDTPRLDPCALRMRKTRPVAHIYSAQELASLLHHARHISARSPIRGVALHAIIGLAASTGMRISEIARLDRQDVALDTGVVLIRQTKFYKDRLVLLHPTTVTVLTSYAAARDAMFGVVDCPAFFIHRFGGRFSTTTLQGSFSELTKRAGLRTARGSRPRFHDLRHSMAVRRLVTWYEAGQDIQAMLPLLATYMGHVQYSHTAYYLQATTELLELAADRYNKSLDAPEQQL